MKEIPGRAMTYEQKRKVLDKILGAWMCTPALRLGQLLINSIIVDDRSMGAYHIEQQLFSIEDEKLLNKVTKFAIGYGTQPSEPNKVNLD